MAYLKQLPHLREIFSFYFVLNLDIGPVLSSVVSAFALPGVPLLPNGLPLPCGFLASFSPCVVLFPCSPSSQRDACAARSSASKGDRKRLSLLPFLCSNYWFLGFQFSSAFYFYVWIDNIVAKEIELLAVLFKITLCSITDSLTYK